MNRRELFFGRVQFGAIGGGWVIHNLNEFVQGNIVIIHYSIFENITILVT